MRPLGQTRTSIKANHAFIAPDSHVKAALPGWTKSDGAVLVSPQMPGQPRFTQYLAIMQKAATASPPMPGVQRFVYVLDGEIVIQAEAASCRLSDGDFAYLPADVSHGIEAQSDCRLLVFEKRYVPSTVVDDRPQMVTGNAWTQPSQAFMGDEDARLRILLSDALAYDMAVNLFTFEPGAALPFVETHIMEHGLYLLEGQGIYRLDEDWHPIQAGDALWMAPYCPQWFCAIGKSPSSYIYYKNVNRDPFAD